MPILPWDEEADAKSILMRILGGTVEDRDPGGGGTQLHDFNVRLDDGAVIAVEVTRCNQDGYLATRGAIDKQDWTSPELRYHWHVGMVGTNFNVRTLRQSLVGPLMRLEAAGIEGEAIRPPFDRPGSAEFETLYNLGVRIVYRLTEPDVPGEAIIDVGEASVGGSTAFSTVDRIASDYSHKADNLAKLQAADEANERHLFIWVESSRHDATVMLDEYAGPELAVPTSEPPLPPAVDCVWLATGFEPARVWSYRRGLGWIHHGRFPLRHH